MTLRARAGSALVAITLDLHEGDVPADITHAAEQLVRAGVRATFFVPSTLFYQQRYAERLRDLDKLGHEVGSHTHLHDAAETDALIRGARSQLGFLEISKRIYEDFYGRNPRSFRSPGWCTLGPAALDELQRLGYVVDSSATPQRLGILGSTPFRRAWTFSPRRLYYLRSGLLEVPTSTVLIPANSMAFRIFRRQALVFVRLLLREALSFNNRVVVLQFHPGEFNPHAGHERTSIRLRLRDFVLRKHGGFGFKYHIIEKDSARIRAVVQVCLSLVTKHHCVTLSDVSRLTTSSDMRWSVPAAAHARMSLTTAPWKLVSRKSRPA
jgi:peptidoglycan/xylan/chitin deacetylase (PgdA/CDA1 family)